MTKENYGKNPTRRSWREEECTNISTDNAYSIRDNQKHKGAITIEQRRGSSGTHSQRTSAAHFSKTVNGKLARQLSKQIETQLAMIQSRRERAIDRIAIYEKTIKELQEDLQNIQEIIEEIENIEEVEDSSEEL